MDSVPGTDKKELLMHLVSGYIKKKLAKEKPNYLNSQ